MSCELFKSYRPRKPTRHKIAMADQIIQEYMSAGYTLTLRQLYYQFVARDLIPNTERSYKNLGEHISRARLGGMLNWDAIEDRARKPVAWREFEDAEELLSWATSIYRRPRLQGQDTYCELWVEKDALAGVLEPLASEYHVTLMVNRGYSSSSAMKDAADRIRHSCKLYDSKQAVILYLGDMDPSGEDMVRDISDRIQDFTNNGYLVDWEKKGDEIESPEKQHARKPYLDVEVQKIALNMDQVDQYKPPPNPAKLTDSRAEAYIEKHGEYSWEVDALPPNVLQQIIRDSIEDVLDMKVMKKIKKQENKEQSALFDSVRRMDLEPIFGGDMELIREALYDADLDHLFDKLEPFIKVTTDESHLDE